MSCFSLLDEILVFQLVLQDELTHLLVDDVFARSGQHFGHAQVHDVWHLGQHRDVRQVAHVDTVLVHDLG